MTTLRNTLNVRLGDDEVRMLDALLGYWAQRAEEARIPGPAVPITRSQGVRHLIREAAERELAQAQRERAMSAVWARIPDADKRKIEPGGDA